MTSCELTMAVAAVANAIAKDTSDADLEVIAAVFVQLGDTLATILAHRAYCESKKESAQQ